MEIKQIRKGDLTFYIECTDVGLGTYAGRQTSPTGIGGWSDVLTDTVFKEIGNVAETVAIGLRSGFSSFSTPKTVEVELGFKITASGKVLLLSGEAETGLTLRIKWEN